MLDIPYGGCGVLASALAMDKAVSKEIFIHNGLPVCQYQLVTNIDIDKDKEGTIDKIEKAVGYPCFVKPANMGSSVGISKAANRRELEEALKLALHHDKRIVVEEYIDCREIETGILGNENPKAAAVGEILPSAEFYDYNAKYCDGGASKLCIPADLSDDVTEQIRRMAVKAYKAVDGEGFARVDFFIRKRDNEVCINEINTLPGFTQISMYPKLWEECGIPYSKLLDNLIELA